MKLLLLICDITLFLYLCTRIVDRW